MPQQPVVTTEALKQKDEKRQGEISYQMKRQGDVLAHALSRVQGESTPYPGDPENLVYDSKDCFVAWTDSVEKEYIRFND